MTDVQEHSSIDKSSSLKKKLANEWLETNGLGSYSSSTELLCHTRKYHGLLVSSSKRLTERTLLISKFDENIIYDGKLRNISLHYYQPGLYVPLEQEIQIDFSFNLNPSWYLKATDLYLKKELMMIDSKDLVILKYDFLRSPAKNSVLELKPLLAFRNFHKILKENNNQNFKLEHCSNGIRISAESSEQSLYIQFNCEFEIQEDAYWYKNFLLQEEVKRGYEAVEDLFCPLSFKINLGKNPDFKVSLSTEELIPAELNDIWYQEKKLRKKSNLGFSKIIKSDSSIFLNRLNNARKDFLVKIDSENYSVIAGYHWFNSWGRDTFIALPGLLLKTKEKGSI